MCGNFLPKTNINHVGRMKGSTLLLLGVGGAVLYYLLKKGRALTSLEFVPRNISFGSGALQLVLGVQNPTSTPLTLRSLVGGVFVNNNRVADISNFTTMVIGPNAETDLTLNIQPDIFGMVNDIISTVSNGFPPNQSIELRATVNVDNNALPVTTKFS